MHPIMAKYCIVIIIKGEMNLDNEQDKDKEEIRKESSFREQR